MNIYDIYTGRKKKIPQTLELTVKCGGSGEAVNLKSGLIGTAKKSSWACPVAELVKINLEKHLTDSK